jgi:hypothetical protein
MNPENHRIEAHEMRPEYGLRGGVRGKYYQQYRQGTNIVLRYASANWNVAPSSAGPGAERCSALPAHARRGGWLRYDQV